MKDLGAYVIAAGGTGGHIIPGIALANEIRAQRPRADVVFVGTAHGLESRIVTAAGYPLELVDASGFVGKTLTNQVQSLARLPKGFFEAMQQGKTALVAELETARRPPADIINAVSAKMLFWLTEAQTPVPIEISPIEDSQAVQTTKEKTSRGSRTPKARNFTHWAGNESAVAGTPVNEDHVRGEMKRIAADLLQLSEDSDLAKTAQVEAVRSLTVQLSKLTAHLVHLSTRDGACRGGTV